MLTIWNQLSYLNSLLSYQWSPLLPKDHLKDSWQRHSCSQSQTQLTYWAPISVHMLHISPSRNLFKRSFLLFADPLARFDSLGPLSTARIIAWIRLEMLNFAAGLEHWFRTMDELLSSADFVHFPYFKHCFESVNLFIR